MVGSKYMKVIPLRSLKPKCKRDEENTTSNFPFHPLRNHPLRSILSNSRKTGKLNLLQES